MTGRFIYLVRIVEQRSTLDGFVVPLDGGQFCSGGEDVGDSGFGDGEDEGDGGSKSERAR